MDMHSYEPLHSLEPLHSRRSNWNNQLARHALMQPNGLALRFTGADTTWLELHQRVQQCAAGLSRRGIGTATA